MVKPVTTAREAFLELMDLVGILDQRLERLENQNLNQRLKDANVVASHQVANFQEQLTRLAEVVADLATR